MVERDPSGGLLELICPACGAIIEAADMAELVVLAREHTLDAHDYDVPDRHVIDAVRDASGS